LRPLQEAPVTALLRALTWPEWRLHPGRPLLALLAIALGVALAVSVHLINASALAEFDAAARALHGTPDFELLPAAGNGYDEALYERVATQPQVAVASPLVEAQVDVRAPDGTLVPMQLLGIDALDVAEVAPQLLPQPEAGAPRLALLDPRSVFLNAAARQRLGAPATLQVQGTALAVRGGVAAGGPPLAVMDIAGAQALAGQLGRLSRIAVKLRPGADARAVVAALALPPGVRAATPDEAGDRMAQLTRAYRVNLTVLSLVALFTGAFLVFSVLSLAVARRVPQFALLGVLGLSAPERRRLVLAEAALLGVAGSMLGLLLGAGLAAAALRLLGGDLGGGYFRGLAPRLHLQPLALAAYGAIGVAAALASAWAPARQAEALAPAQALKGLGLDAARPLPAWAGPLLLVLAAVLATLPPLGELPLAAYLAVACGLLGGIACVPALLSAALAPWRVPRRPLLLLALQRARQQRAQASVAVAGVVAALALGVALTVMVGSFRHAVDDWLGQLLPADLYVRAGSTDGTATPLPPALVQAAAGLPGVARMQPQRVLALSLDAHRPPVALLARQQAGDLAQALPLKGEALPAPAGEVGVFASEAMAALYGATPGRTLLLPLPAAAPAPATPGVRVFVRGLWRDYARQHGALVMPLADYQRLTGDRRVTDLALWLAPGADLAAVQQALRSAAAPQPLELATTRELRALSLRIFDRSFAVTGYLQAVAIAIGLFGIAASFSSQVLARRKEFGMLAHLGLTRGDLLRLVAGEGALWTAAGTVLGLLLGLAVAVVLVYVVNPQSFHWTMPLRVPWPRVGALCAAVLAAGTVTAALAGRAAAGREMALAVKEDW
jgi:putative ABC transport system permease protein